MNTVNTLNTLNTLNTVSTVDTVNVITTDETGLIQAINAFEDTDDGNKEAERIFKKKLNSVLNLDVTDDEAEVFVEDGYAVNSCGETCQLAHSY